MMIFKFFPKATKIVHIIYSKKHVSGLWIAGGSLIVGGIWIVGGRLGMIGNESILDGTKKRAKLLIGNRAFLWNCVKFMLDQLFCPGDSKAKVKKVS
jgi:hypothetical protein